MSRRTFEILRRRCGTRNDGWVFPSKRSASGYLRSICNLFRQARIEAGLPKDLVLYRARHDYGTRILMRTGNLAAVMKTMGHRDVRSAMHYQHPELEVVRAALDYGEPSETTETTTALERGYDTFPVTPLNLNAGMLFKPSPVLR